jgi:hypothetical protein
MIRPLLDDLERKALIGPREQPWKSARRAGRIQAERTVGAGACRAIGMTVKVACLSHFGLSRLAAAFPGLGHKG